MEIELKNLVADESVKRNYQSINNKNTENETESSSTRSESDQEGAGRGGNRLESSMHAESTISRGGGKHGKYRGERKKPRYLSPNDSIIKRHRTKYTPTRIKYSPTRIKSRNVLLNISYTGINKGNFYNENFILDVFILLLKNLNPFSLQRKTPDKLKHEMVYMLWRECIPSEFYRYICQDENFKYLNGRDANQSGVLEIVGNFIDQKKDNLRLLQANLANYKDIYQYVYAHVFPERYSTTEKRGIDLKSNFHIMFQTYRGKAILQQHQIITSTKNPANFENIREESSEFEQKPIKKFNEFSDGEEEELKQQAEKRKQTRREQSQESKSKKLKLKQEEVKEKESKMWE